MITSITETKKMNALPEYIKKTLLTFTNPDTCWAWPHYVDKAGYGSVNIKNDEGKWTNKKVHSVVYEASGGIVPAGKELDHICRNRSCVNPNHLEPVSHVENMKRAGLVKIDLDIAENIRSMHQKGIRNKELSINFGVSPSHISNIIKNKKWRTI